MRVLCLVNGRELGYPASRAWALFGGASRHQVTFCYRQGGRWGDTRRLFAAVRANRPDLVYVFDMAVPGIVAALAARAFGLCPFAVDTGDAVYEYSRLVTSRSRLTCELLGLMEPLAYRRAAAIVVRGTRHKEHLETLGYGNVHVIQEYVDLERTRPVDAADLQRQLGLVDAFVVGLVGSLRWNGRWRMCYGWDLVEALPHVESPRVRGLIVGGGDGLPKLQARAAELGVADKLVFTGRVPQHEVYRYINAMDACLSTQTNNLVGQVRTTIKLPEYLACGKYVIATDVGEASLVLGGIGSLLPYRADVVRDDGYPLLLAREIDRLAARPEITQQVAQRARETAREHFEVGMLARRAEGLLDDIAQRLGR